jgi:hypothetical protein
VDFRSRSMEDGFINISRWWKPCDPACSYKEM